MLGRIPRSKIEGVKELRPEKNDGAESRGNAKKRPNN